MLRYLLLLAGLFLAAPAAAEPSVALYCARGTPDFPDADMKLNPRGSHVVDVVFVGYRPSRMRADWSLRDCLYTASRLDSSRGIVARLWYRDRGQRDPYELLQTAVLPKP